MRSFAIATALLLLAGCQEPAPPAAGPVQTLPAQPPAPPGAPGQAAPGPPAAPKEATRKNSLPTDQEEFKAAVEKKTREQLLEMYGPPDELGEWGAAVGWDGPVSIYKGPFTTADGKQNAKALVYFRQNVVASVGFTNQ